VDFLSSLIEGSSPLQRHLAHNQSNLIPKRYKAIQAGNQAEADRLAPIEAEYCRKANDAIREYYQVLDYERNKMNK
jgi:hypothetical protein